MSKEQAFIGFWLLSKSIYINHLKLCHLFQGFPRYTLMDSWLLLFLPTCLEDNSSVLFKSFCFSLFWLSPCPLKSKLTEVIDQIMTFSSSLVSRAVDSISWSISLSKRQEKKNMKWQIDEMKHRKKDKIDKLLWNNFKRLIMVCTYYFTRQFCNCLFSFKNILTMRR